MRSSTSLRQLRIQTENFGIFGLQLDVTSPASSSLDFHIVYIAFLSCPRATGRGEVDKPPPTRSFHPAGGCKPNALLHLQPLVLERR